MTLKKCVSCGEVKPATRFPVKKPSGNAFNRCCDCQKASRAATYRKYLAQNRAKGIAYAKRRAQADPEGRRAYWREQRRAWSRRDGNGVKAYRRNAEKHRARGSAWKRKQRQLNPEAVRAAERKIAGTKNAKRRGAVMGAAPVGYERIKARDKMRCHLCRKKVKPADLNIDHVIPLSKGGKHEESNLAVSHEICNLKKFNAIVTLF